MRLITIIGLLLLGLGTAAQNDSLCIGKVEDAISVAFNNHSAIPTEYDRKALASEIKSTWYTWLYQINKGRVLQEYLGFLEDLNRVAALRYAEGDIELLEKSWFLANLAEVKTSYAVTDNDAAISLNKLKQLIQGPSKIVPADSGLILYQISKSQDRNPVMPSPVSRLQMENLQLQLDGYFMQVGYFESAGLDHAQLIMKINRAKYEAEEIDYLEYTKSLAEAFQIRMAYFETLNNYNQTALQLEHYAY